MRTWNRKHKPKHWTKPKWKTRMLESSIARIYHLVTRGIKDKDKITNHFFRKINNKPRYKFLSKSIEVE